VRRQKAADYARAMRRLHEESLRRHSASQEEPALRQPQPMPPSPVQSDSPPPAPLAVGVPFADIPATSSAAGHGSSPADPAPDLAEEDDEAGNDNADYLSPDDDSEDEDEEDDEAADAGPADLSSEPLYANAKPSVTQKRLFALLCRFRQTYRCSIRYVLCLLFRS
jgi:hypothetical protein